MLQNRDSPPRNHFALSARNVTLSHVAWGLTVAFSGRIAAGVGPWLPVLTWELIVLFLVPLFLPLRYRLATLISVIVFLDQSLWFLHGRIEVDTIYEHAATLVKPPEIVLFALCLRLVSANWRQSGFPAIMLCIYALWLFVILISVGVALHHGNGFGDILVFSEFRVLVSSFLAVLILFQTARRNLAFVVDCFAILLAIQLFISLVSWSLGLSLLWQSYAPNYVGNWAAFFGADESVMVALVGFVLAISLMLAPDGRPELTRLPRWFWGILLSITLFAILASARRGGIASVTIVISSVAIFASLHTKYRLVLSGAFLAAILAGLVVFDPFSSVADNVMSRLTGKGNVVQSDTGRALDKLQAREYVDDHFVFGTGPGTKLPLLRTQAYGVVESLSIHHSLLHVWVRFGLAGIVLYCALYAVPATFALRLATRPSRVASAAWHLLISASLGYILAQFLWGLYTPAIYINFRQMSSLILVTSFILVARNAFDRPVRSGAGAIAVPRTSVRRTRRETFE